MELAGRTILVTGANRGIGRAITERLAREPVRLLVGVRDLDRHERIEAPSDGATEIRPVRMDLGSRESIDECLDALGPELENIDILINNAGEFTAGQVEQQDLGLVYAMVQANLLGPMHLTHRILPGMLRRGNGKIVNQGSIVGYMFFPGVSTYSATKAGVIGFTECLARELHDTDVSVLELVTGGVDTDMLAVAREELAEHMDTSSFIQYSPEEWADKVVDAIRSDDAVLGPGGKAALGKLATRGPRWLLDTVAARSFERAGEGA